MTEDIPYTHRFVASPDTGKRFARAFLSRAHQMRRQWVSYSFFLMVFTLIAATGMREGLSPQARLVWFLVFALVPTVIFVILVIAMSYFRMVRASKARLFNGAVMESGFGTDEMVIRNTLASSRTAYIGIKSVAARGDFVFLKHHGSQLVCAYPRELFPDEAIDRILRASR